MTADLFEAELAEAVEAYGKYIVCLDKTPAECRASLTSLITKAIHAYQNRGPNLRHGIALDRHLTVIISHTENGARPLCAIYFNLHTPYQRRGTMRPANSQPETTGESPNS